MKIKKLIISILIILILVNIKTKCYAKYVFEEIKIAAEIIINN